MRHKLVNNRYRWTPDNNEPDDGTITNTKMATDAIHNINLADNAVNTAELADNAVTTAKITDANVSTAKLADNAVTTAKITDANVSTAKLADDAVTNAKVATDAIGLAELSATGTASSSTYLRGDNTWATVSGGGGGGGLFTSYARLSDVKAYNEHAGAVPNDNYFTYRTLNTEDWDPDGIIIGVGGKATSGNLKKNNTNYSVTTESYEFALGAGSYLIKFRAPYVQTDASVGWILDTTNSNTVIPESVNNSEYSQDSGVYSGGYVSGSCRVTITADTKYAVRQHFQKDRADYGLGVMSNIASLGRSVYTVVEIYKEA
tara:strand:+ start:192 stop:1145 length:954 start_codon:yes stop_codon:yes gene_type:complete